MKTTLGDHEPLLAALALHAIDETIRTSNSTRPPALQRLL
jgi:hypothetical protein